MLHSSFEKSSLHTTSPLLSFTIAASPMQSLARPASLSKGCFSEFCCVLDALPRDLLAQTKFLRYRCALLTFPPTITRSGVCIGCDRAAHQRKEENHEQYQTVPSRLRRDAAQGGHRPERLLARNRCRLAAQERRQGLRHRHSRRHQRERTYRLHGAQDERQSGIADAGRPLELRLRRAVFINASGQSRPCGNQPEETQCQYVRKQDRLSTSHRYTVLPSPARTMQQYSSTSGSNATSRKMPSHSEARRSASIREACATLWKSPTGPIRQFSICSKVSRREGSGNNAHRGLNRAGRLFGCSAFFLPIARDKQNAARVVGCVLRVVSQQNHSDCGTRRKHIASLDDFRFSHRMIRVVISDSKLCLVTPDHATDFGPSARPVAPTWQGRGEPLPLHPSPVRLFAAAETVPVSTPSAEVRP